MLRAALKRAVHVSTGSTRTELARAWRVRVDTQTDSPLAVSVQCGGTEAIPFALSVALATQSKGERIGVGLT